MKRLLLAFAITAATMVAGAPVAGAQYCAPDDASLSCQAQRRCQQLQRKLGPLISCTQ